MGDQLAKQLNQPRPTSYISLVEGHLFGKVKQESNGID